MGSFGGYVMLRLFGMEGLEGRTLFCAGSTASAPTPSITSMAVVQQAVMAVSKSLLAVAFNVAGKFTHPISPGGNPDVGSKYNFSGTGKTKNLGKFTLTGYVQPPGFIAIGKASGRLVITTSNGKINLNVQGPPQQPGTLPSSLTFNVASGSGEYLGISGKGKILVSASATTHKFLFRFNPPK
jgi:hypothetical protein